MLLFKVQNDEGLIFVLGAYFICVKKDVRFLYFDVAEIYVGRLMMCCTFLKYFDLFVKNKNE